jgi:hypothetical protein
MGKEKRKESQKREVVPIKSSREREVFRWRNGLQVWLTTPKQGIWKVKSRKGGIVCRL